eukprot:3315159-Karenia_brevis.AAC.1
MPCHQSGVHSFVHALPTPNEPHGHQGWADLRLSGKQDVCTSAARRSSSRWGAWQLPANLS